MRRWPPETEEGLKEKRKKKQETRNKKQVPGNQQPATGIQQPATGIQQPATNILPGRFLWFVSLSIQRNERKDCY